MGWVLDAVDEMKIKVPVSTTNVIAVQIEKENLNSVFHIPGAGKVHPASCRLASGNRQRSIQHFGLGHKLHGRNPSRPGLKKCDGSRWN